MKGWLEDMWINVQMVITFIILGPKMFYKLARGLIRGRSDWAMDAWAQAFPGKEFLEADGFFAELKIMSEWIDQIPQ
jgi:hypothetical protein